MSPALQELTTDGDQHYDADARMLVTEFRSPGYHTRIASGTPVHPTRESLIYALGLLQRNATGDTRRAAEIIRRVVDLQDTNLDSKTCGVWPWLLEEPLSEMKSPDLNWADFCGSQLVHILLEHPRKLPPELQSTMRDSLRHAVTAIRRRNVSPGYTNIAILGGVVCVAAGELLSDHDLLTYGSQRLQRVVEHVEEHGGFSEYNSPPYSKVIIGECERLLHLVSDPASRAAAESLRRTCWEEIATSFHPATQQWAGPHSRNSRLYLQPTTVEFLSIRTGVEIQTHPQMVGDTRPGRYATVPPLPCPADLLPRFRQPQTEPRQTRSIYARDKSGTPSIVGTTWHSATACLGSVNRASLWTQRKPLIAYWKTDNDPAVVFRVRFLHDGKDFASIGIRTAQTGPRALCLFASLPDRGDWHRTLDRPANGIFQANDLRVRFELVGTGAMARRLEDGRFELAAGSHRIVVHTLPGRFAGNDVAWKLGDDNRSVEGICYQGDVREFNFKQGIDVNLCAGIELIPIDQAITAQRPRMTEQPAGSSLAEWSISQTEKLEVKWSGQ
jgi:hypothetical protein